MRKPASSITPQAQTWNSMVKKENKNKVGKTHGKGTGQAIACIGVTMEESLGTARGGLP